MNEALCTRNIFFGQVFFFFKKSLGNTLQISQRGVLTVDSKYAPGEGGGDPSSCLLTVS